MRRVAALMLLGALAACTTAPRAPQQAVPQVALPPPPPPGEPVDIVGLQAQQLKTAFGDPAFVRKDGPAQMWRYDGMSCKAFFFLYSAGAALTVKHVETLPRGTVMAADQACLAQLRRGSLPAVS